MTNEKILRLIPNYRYTDEYERKVLLNIYAKLYVWIFWGTLIISTLDIFVSMYLKQIPVVSILAMIALTVASIVFTSSLRNKKIDRFEVDSKKEYQRYIKKARKGSFIFAFAMFIVFNINNYLIPFVIHQSLPENSELTYQLLIFATIAAIAGWIIYMISKAKITRTYKD
ncbi:hypothetical protein OWI77_05495 [Staphylococcus nepalensis]|uniref:DUF3278 domain-containing protein n=1 Tax=Staphylococcus nepalensis TaxID=214473 RepID=UPI0022717865|nr:DUF3278 domain-containing protein [Staphylococcus nepalensis]MCY1038275.1 hypothetical protein [Staphylococcus nepalensis]